MKKIFIDTNVIIDFLADRQPFSNDAAILFQLAQDSKIQIYVSAISFNNTYYILKKVTSHKTAIQLISAFEEFIQIQETNKIILRRA